MNWISKIARRLIDHAAKIASWIGKHVRALWDAHTEALEASAAYRRQVLVLTGAILTLLAIAGPLDAVLAASAATYVAAHVADEERTEHWRTPALPFADRDKYYDERGW